MALTKPTSNEYPKKALIQVLKGIVHEIDKHTREDISLMKLDRNDAISVDATVSATTALMCPCPAKHLSLFPARRDRQKVCVNFFEASLFLHSLPSQTIVDEDWTSGSTSSMLADDGNVAAARPAAKAVGVRIVEVQAVSTPDNLAYMCNRVIPKIPYKLYKMVKPIFPCEREANGTHGQHDVLILGGVSGRPESATEDERGEGVSGFSFNHAFTVSDNDEVFVNDTSESSVGNSNFLQTPLASYKINGHAHQMSTPNEGGDSGLPLWSCDSVSAYESLQEPDSYLTSEDVCAQVRPVAQRKRAPSSLDKIDAKPLEVPPALQDIAAKGQELFWFILSEELKAQEAIQPGTLSSLTIPPCTQRVAILDERSRTGGRTLREIAETFAQSQLRTCVSQRAFSVDLQSLSYTTFSDLLFGLFQEGGVTQERVLVLFFFCADLALRALREKLTLRFQQLVDWTSRYITERLSSWVLEHGGWAAVLQDSVNKAYKVAVVTVCFISLVVCTAFVFQRVSRR